MGTFRETLADGDEGALHLGPERPQLYSDLSPEEKERGLRDSNYDQLYAYLKQHKAHANENKLMLDRFTQHTVDPLALMSNVSHHQGQGNNVRGTGSASYEGAQKKVRNTNPCQARQIKCYSFNGIGHIARNCTQPKRPQNSEYFKDKMLSMQAQENRVALDEEQLLFITDPVYDEAVPSYDSDIMSEVHDHDNYQDAVCELHGVHEMHDHVQPNCVVDSNAEYSSDSNTISYDHGQEIVKSNHDRVFIHDSKDTLEIAESTIKQMNEKMKDPECVKKKDLIKITDEALKEQTPALRPIKVLTVNNREVHLDYLKHLKESVATLREIIEEARVVRHLDRLLASTCHYAKHSHELLEHAVGTCPKDFNKQDNKLSSTPLTRNKQVTFEDQCVTSNNNTHKHVEQLEIQNTNVPVIHSTGVNSCTDASGSKPRSNTNKNRISPAKSVNKKKVEEHHRTNKSSLNRTNRVDSSISSTRTLVQI
nr:hypothetical protein [Tanacetum cinerariifolium]